MDATAVVTGLVAWETVGFAEGAVVIGTEDEAGGACCCCCVDATCTEFGAV